MWRKIGRPVILTTTSISIFLEVSVLSRHKQKSARSVNLGGCVGYEASFFKRFPVTHKTSYRVV